MAQTVQRRRHQEPAQLSRLAPRPRSLGRPSHSTKLDQKRHRKRAIPTTNAVRAFYFLLFPGIRTYQGVMRDCAKKKLRSIFACPGRPARSDDGQACGGFERTG